MQLIGRVLMGSLELIHWLLLHLFLCWYWYYRFTLIHWLLLLDLVRHSRSGSGLLHLWLHLFGEERPRVDVLRVHLVLKDQVFDLLVHVFLLMFLHIWCHLLCQLYHFKLSRCLKCVLVLLGCQDSGFDIHFLLLRRHHWPLALVILLIRLLWYHLLEPKVWHLLLLL